MRTHIMLSLLVCAGCAFEETITSNPPPDFQTDSGDARDNTTKNTKKEEDGGIEATTPFHLAKDAGRETSKASDARVYPDVYGTITEAATPDVDASVPEAAMEAGTDSITIVTDTGDVEIPTIEAGTDSGASDAETPTCSALQRCSGNIPQSCSYGIWTDGPSCPFVCFEGACIGICVPGSKQCSGVSPQVCNTWGQWENSAPCPYSCNDGECSGECLPGSKQCLGQTAQGCSSQGKWVDLASCQYVCTNGECSGSCTSGATQCSGSSLLACNTQGFWDVSSVCPYVCSNGSCIGSCVPGAHQCSGLTPQTCGANGQWQNGSSCQFICSGGSCTGSCTPGTRQCSGNVTQVCDPTGRWQNEVVCSNTCSAGNCAGSCVPGSKQCSDRTPQTCDSNGQWQSSAACPFVCSGGNCSGVCVPNSKQCNGNTPQSCDVNGQWQNEASCPFVCSNGSCAGACTPGLKQCSGSIPQTCDVNGQWQSTSACQYVCSSGICTGVCTPGSVQCSGTTLQTCDSNGQWQNGSSCPYVCSGGSCTGVCVPGSRQCSGTLSQVCSSSGQWQNDSVCPYVCSGGSCTGVCVPGTKQCSGAIPQTCDSSGQWQSGATCQNGCTNGECNSGSSWPSCGTDCSGIDCCDSILVPGGTFPMGRGTADACPYSSTGCSSSEIPEHSATVDAFYLDRFEVSVSRFRKFVDSYNGTPPAADAGAHPKIPGSGWQSSWNSLLPTSQSALKSAIKCGTQRTWTDTVGNNEQYAIDCVTVYEAFAFCIWDGGRLPTEAEWEYAAAGGNDNRRYPWGSDLPTADLVNCKDTAYTPYLSVNGYPNGQGKWGHRNLAGGVWELVRDWYNTSWYSNGSCDNCCNLSNGVGPGIKGGGWTSSDCPISMRVAKRADASNRYAEVGFRCARNP